ncbi:MAG: bifunctional 5,10-methylene-tetrahydrofolate dehydrogenase/5,10-methylene-tetrahydrofolate cyclohydrolase [Spirochaetaceae bacterium]|jgi:methylenetetrahydrofolate dehydrogenase (NADP+)/methenyltetrahydrofolate cyclohydrolase|nr:bifunctional 5,10-methylene-tetrahydrofolate dehydrogenase/5,10-methylene-tetrahydrofolate cyclohydrolase [Spirochaetaceae bacterium]
MATIINGKIIAQHIRNALAAKVAELKKEGIVPTLAVILLGEDPASLSYIAGKEKALAQTGMKSREKRLPADTSEAQLLQLIADFNTDPSVHGILVQLPLPAHINTERVLCALDPAKDVDGFHPLSVGNVILERAGFIPCTPQGIVVLLQESHIPLDGAEVVIVGRSNLVGKPLANLLSRRSLNATVTLCHTGTKNLAAHTRNADIVIAAMGKPRFITADMVRAGAVVIDVGMNRVADTQAKNGYRLCGDVDYVPVAAKASYITPVPGGVGPLTIAMLLKNVVDAATALRST